MSMGPTTSHWADALAVTVMSRGGGRNSASTAQGSVNVRAEWVEPNVANVSPGITASMQKVVGKSVVSKIRLIKKCLIHR